METMFVEENSDLLTGIFKSMEEPKEELIAFEQINEKKFHSENNFAESVKAPKTFTFIPAGQETADDEEWDEKEKSQFKITDDALATWAGKKIKKEEEEFERIKAAAEAEIAEIKEKLKAAQKRCENKTFFLKGKLREYFYSVEKTETSTQKKYEMLHMTLLLKKGAQDFEKNEEALIAYLKEMGLNQFVKNKETVLWGDLKKRLTITLDGRVVDKETNAEFKCIRSIQKPDTFEIKFR